MSNFKGIRLTLLFALVVAFAVGVGSPTQASPPVRTFLVLGDSVAHGQTHVPTVSAGDQGYVRPFADYLADQFDGFRPTVINLAIPGETSDSVFTGLPPRPDWIRAIGLNTNYAAPTETQFGKLLATIAAEKAAGHRITHVSLALGGNDFFALLGSLEFNAPGADHAALIQGMLAHLAENYAILLTVLRSELPHAKILLPTYYNPFTVFGPGHPLNFLTEGTVQGHGRMVAELGRAFKARPIDVHSAFRGNEGVYTNIMGVFVGLPLDLAFHPTDTGYAVIAQLMAAAVE